VLGDVQPGLLEGQLSTLQKRITALLQQKGVETGEGDSRIHIQPVAGRAVPGRLFQDILGALVQRRRLHIRYHGRRRDEVSERDISPQRLTQYRNSWYLDAWCHAAEGLRSFALEKVLDQALLEEPALEVKATALAEHYDRSYGIFSGPAQHTARIRFSPEMSRWVADEQWHPDQAGELDAEGAWLLEVPFSDPRELVMDILRYGPDAEVLAPDFLREAVRDAAGRTAGQYAT
jgi:predicted DNA-binding transcriptional regulator YafY